VFSNNLPGENADEFRHHANYRSQYLEHTRDVIVNLPPGYEASDRRYPVIYMHDGQNLFNPSTAFGGVEWGVHRTARRAIERGEIEPMIIVGVYNTGQYRIDEYTPTVDSKQKRGGKADLYGRFIVEDLKNFVDRQYRTMAGPENTGMGGSSLGGLVTLYLGLKYPQVFSRLMVMSPSVWWDQGLILRLVRGLRAKPSTRIWLDVGTKEGKFAPSQTRMLRDELISQGWRLDSDLKFLQVKGGQHNERDWGDRVEPAFKFLFPK
jgi:predicted alpha/beta superfamily hydrolase